ncbi:MAG: hypothetical protein JNM31_14465 [Flavobacteriales bacterium]|nr:hypothetical protein [Flavobacteriales bacterium]
MLDYLLRLQGEGTERAILLVTEEPPGSVDDPELRADLVAVGIQWLRLGYDVRGAQWSQKLRNLLRIHSASRSFLRGAAERWLVGYLSFGGSYALLLGMLGLGRSATVCFEPHSRYMTEMGIWGRRSAKALFMGWLERLQMRRMDALIVPTRAGEQLALGYGRKGALVRQPITIDVQRSLHDAAARSHFRQAHGLNEGDELIGYVGKFGGIYYAVEEYLRFLHGMHHVRPTLHFLILAGHADLDAVRAHALFAVLGRSLILHPPVPPDRLHEVLSAADWGVIAVPPTPAQVFRTPVKTAHYWAAGLPLIIPRGISDDHTITAEEGVGVVVDDLRDVDAGRLLVAMDTLRGADPKTLRDRCMAAAWKHRDTSNMIRVIRSLLP